MEEQHRKELGRKKEDRAQRDRHTETERDKWSDEKDR